MLHRNAACSLLDMLQFMQQRRHHLTWELRYHCQHNADDTLFVKFLIGATPNRILTAAYSFSCDIAHIPVKHDYHCFIGILVKAKKFTRERKRHLSRDHRVRGGLDWIGYDELHFSEPAIQHDGWSHSFKSD